jgi:hypothetical protein
MLEDSVRFTWAYGALARVGVPLGGDVADYQFIVEE